MTNAISLQVNDLFIEERTSDGYINATAMCQAAGKRYNDYARMKRTNEFLTTLCLDLGISITDLVQVVRTLPSQSPNTWVHPQVAFDLAQWVSAKFAVAVADAIYQSLAPGQLEALFEAPQQKDPQIPDKLN